MKRLVGVLMATSLLLAGAACSSSTKSTIKDKSSSAIDSAKSVASNASDSAKSLASDTGSSDSSSTGTGSSDTGSTDTATSDSGSSDSTPTSPALKAKLLTAEELGAGWKEETDNSNDNTSLPACLKGTKSDFKAKAEAKARYVHGTTGFPLVSENIGAFGNKAPSTFTKFSKILQSCNDASFTDSGETVSGTAKPIALTKVGVDSTAVDFAYTVKGVNVDLSIILILKGDNLALVVVGTLGAPEVSALQPIADGAAAKL